jgi:hypothetical protein
MPKKRKTRPIVPIGKAPSVAAAPVTSLKLARKLTSKFHALLNERAAIDADKTLGPAERASKVKLVEEQITAIGGRAGQSSASPPINLLRPTTSIAAYQEASALSTSKFRNSRYVFKTLTGLGLQPGKGQPPLKVLEVGATNAQLLVCPWLRVRAIGEAGNGGRGIANTSN